MAAVAGPIPAASGRIFISYRREETAYPAGWLFDRLADRFGRDQIFKDVDSIELGDDFVKVINSAVGSCDVLLALIGDQWLTVTDGQGNARLDNPDDYVRLEIEAALTRDVRVIPILVGRASMPRADQLPPSLAMLVRRNALELSPSRFEFDTGRLLKVLERTLGDVRGQPPVAEPEIAVSTRDARVRALYVEARTEMGLGHPQTAIEILDDLLALDPNHQEAAQLRDAATRYKAEKAARQQRKEQAEREAQEAARRQAEEQARREAGETARQQPLYRAGQRPRAKGWRRAANAAVTAVIASLIVAAVISGLHHDAGAGSSNSASSSPTFASTTPTKGFLTLEQLRAGDCLTGSHLPLKTSGTWPKLSHAVSCRRRHIAEVFYATNTYWAAGSAYPGDKAIMDDSLSQCDRYFNSYVGIPPSQSEFSYNYVRPDTDTWHSGDRGLDCIAYWPTDHFPGAKPLFVTIKHTRK